MYAIEIHLCEFKVPCYVWYKNVPNQRCIQSISDTTQFIKNPFLIVEKMLYYQIHVIAGLEIEIILT